MNKCEICGKNSDMHMNCWFPSFGEMFDGYVCLDCFKHAEWDMKLAVQIVGKRLTAANEPLPTTMDVIRKYLKHPDTENTAESDK